MQMPQSSELAWDLRTFYAYIVGPNLISIAEARQEENYTKYWHALNDLYVVISHKIKPKKTDVEADGKTAVTFDTLSKKALAVFNLYPEAFNGKSTDPKQKQLIWQALAEIEKYLYAKMDDAGLFGKGRIVEGLI